MNYEELLPGTEVYYIPLHARGKKTHPSSEPGRVHSKLKDREDGVFVQYYEKENGVFTEKLQSIPKWTSVKLLVHKETPPTIHTKEDNEGCLNFPEWPLD